MEREVQSIIIGNHHAHRETLVLVTKVVIQHVKSLGHHSLSDSDRHAHHKSVDDYNATWNFIMFIRILQGSNG